MTRRAVMVLWLCATLTAQSAAAQDGNGISVNELWFEKSERGYALRARMNAASEQLAHSLLQSGYVLKWRFEMRFMQRRDWFPDREIGDISWTPEILYDSLLDRYTFSAGGAPEEYGSLSAALQRAGFLRAAPQKNSQLEEIFNRSGIYFIARYEILIDHLPQPLQVSLLTGDAEINSGWQWFDSEVRE